MFDHQNIIKKNVAEENARYFEGIKFLNLKNAYFLLQISLLFLMRF